MKHNYLLRSVLILAAASMIMVGCKKDQAEPINNNQDQEQQEPEAEVTILGTWTMTLDKSYSQVTEYDDKMGVDVITGATGGDTGGDDGDEDIPQGGRVTYMNQTYTSATLSFGEDGVATRSYTRPSGTSTNTYSYTQNGNTIKMDNTKFYIVNLTKNSLVLETQRIYMAKGKDVYCEFLHLVYTR